VSGLCTAAFDSVQDGFCVAGKRAFWFLGTLWGVPVAPQKKEAPPWYLVNRKKGVPPLNICNKSLRHIKENPLESGLAYLAAGRGRRAGRPQARAAQPSLALAMAARAASRSTVNAP
jgi:hypothetical protein